MLVILFADTISIKINSFKLVTLFAGSIITNKMNFTFLLSILIIFFEDLIVEFNREGEEREKVKPGLPPPKKIKVTKLA